MLLQTRPAEKPYCKNEIHSEKSQPRPFISKRLSFLGAVRGKKQIIPLEARSLIDL